MPDRILLTSPVYPYPVLPNNTSITDPMGARFTRGDGIFGMLSHTHCFANHILAQNIETPSTVLEYPRWRDFTAEVDKGYPIVGISALPVHLDSVLRMCEYVRSRSPSTKILLGCYAGMAMQRVYDAETCARYVDHIVHGEGVRFLREMLGEKVDRPIRQMLMPKAGGAPRFVTRFPKGAVGFLVSGLGCPGRCDFCSSTALFDHQRIEMLSPRSLVDHMVRYHRQFPLLPHVFVIEEDHFRWPDYLADVRENWLLHPELAESLDWFGFGSLGNIQRFVDKYGWDAIAETGLGVLFVGVESKFADQLKYNKLANADARTIFSRLHRMGIRTVGSWVCGWDFHDHANVIEDLNFFVSLAPTYQQLTRLSPFPGTPLWDQMEAEGRLRPVAWEDIHFWSGTQKHLALEDHETLNVVEDGYDLMHRTWGPSLLRRLDVHLDGLVYCRSSSNPVIRDHRAKHFAKLSGLFWALLPAMERYAPNGPVRRRAAQIDKKYRAVVGEPTAVMQLLAKVLIGLSTVARVSAQFSPPDLHPKLEPFKRYIFDKPAPADDDFPYRTEWPSRIPLRTGAVMAREWVRDAFLDAAMRTVRAAARNRRDPLIDDYLVGLVSNGLGFGL
jgi:haloalkane dehalogenase